MSIFDLIYRRLLLPAYKPDSFGNLSARWNELAAAERSSLAENHARQWAEVQRMVAHAYETTPFYRERLDSVGVTPIDLKSPSDLAKIPALTREDLRSCKDALISSEYSESQLLGAATGGTTESPVPLYRDRKCLQTRNADQLRFNLWAGCSPSTKVFWLWGAAVDFATNPSWRWKLWERYVLREVWAPSSELNEAICEKYRQRLNSFRPKTIIAYPTPLAIFAEYLADSSKEYWRPKNIIVTAEPLSPEQRKVIAKTFAVEPYLQYGARDFGMIASECERHRGLHYNPLAVYLELQPIGEGVAELLVTDLTNRAMPMIRYKIGDCALPIEGPCSCGRGFPRISEVVGRTVDNFVLANGSIVPGVALTNRVLKDCSVLKKVQIVQQDYEDFMVRYVPGPRFSDENLRAVEDVMHAFIGETAKIAFVQVDDIRRERSGKTRLCISHVKQTAQAHLAELATEGRA